MHQGQLRGIGISLPNALLFICLLQKSNRYLIKTGNSFLYYHESALVKSTSGNLCLISADTMFYFGTGLGIVSFYYKKWKLLRLKSSVLPYLLIYISFHFYKVTKISLKFKYMQFLFQFQPSVIFSLKTTDKGVALLIWVLRPIGNHTFKMNIPIVFQILTHNYIKYILVRKYYQNTK